MKHAVTFFWAVAIIGTLAQSAHATERIMYRVDRKGDKELPTMPKQQLEKIRNSHAAFHVDVSVDREDHAYEYGEHMTVTVNSERDGYLWFFYEQADGRIVCLFPNQFQQNNWIQGQKRIQVPPPGGGFQYVARAPAGYERLMAIVTLKQLSPAQLGIQSPLKGNSGQVDKDTLLRGSVKGMGIVPNWAPDPTEWAEDETTIQVVESRPLGTGGQQSSKPRQKPEGELERTPENSGNQGRSRTEVVPLKQHRRLGLFIGINQFQDKRIRDLKVSAQDATQMAELMLNFGQLDVAILLTDEDATLAKVRSEFEKLVAESQPGDEIFIYWSGHGAQCADDVLEGGEEKDGLDEYLVPNDGQFGTIDQIRNSMLSDDEFGRWIQELKDRKVVIILDVCHAGGLSALDKAITPSADFNFCAGEMKRIQSLTKDVGADDAVMLCSSHASETSKERRDLTLSVMTYYLTQLLRTEPHLSVTQAFEEIGPEVKKYITDEFSGSSQTLFMAPDKNKGNSILLRP